MADPVTEDNLPELTYPLADTDNILVGRGGLLYRADKSKLFPYKHLPQPTLSAYSSTRAGSGSLADSDYGPVITSVITSTNTNSLQYLLRTISRGGTNSYRYTAKIRRNCPVNRFSPSGLILRDSVGGKSTLIGVMVDTVAGFNRNRYDSDTLFNAVAGVMAMFTANGETVLMPDYYMKIEDDNTNRKTFFSLDGASWIELQSEGNTTFVTPTHVGVVFNPNGFSSGGSLQGKTVQTTVLGDLFEAY